MVKLLGPCFSLAASGDLGKAIFYYDTKYGARARIKRRSFTPPSQSWIINQEWFKAADVRSRILTWYQKRAWELAYPVACDAWRDVFIGKQIEFWNLSPMNDLTWPPIKAGSPGAINANPGRIYQNLVGVYIEDEDVVKRKRWSVSWVWWLVLDNARNPVEADIIKRRPYSSYWEVEFEAGHVNYVWGGVQLADGTFVFDSAGSYDRT